MQWVLATRVTRELLRIASRWPGLQAMRTCSYRRPWVQSHSAPHLSSRGRANRCRR